MNCEHTETTTLLWMYGEGPEDHDLHVAECPACSEVLAMHSDVMSALPAQRPLPVAPVTPVPANGPGWRGGWMAAVVASVALAAAAVVAVMPTPEQELVDTEDTDVALRVIDVEGFEEPDFDIDRELDVLMLELETL